MRKESETMLKTENGFTICEVVQMENGEPGIRVKTGKNYYATSLDGFLQKYWNQYKRLYGLRE